ncbi:hypothetical protein NITGR_150042 [Nitrospina gracilis 3/211]|uniref:HTH luxR-type domain-containing protein n=1 Tax=Nitrospina gracilis (strain 3/211) TaxID=1266370 RepID=M1YW42_NITG3|nr:MULTISPECIES: helix-turn-helix transcriptional regulator [Nitrospina]MCF8722726.1 DNA-binding CsgD family transcriptional regulator [Nitrospina sp. Nb-3]CCQ89674.1 hypothetical protein NITGR_150042 [Nitrospina gracilis 3/211]
MNNSKRFTLAETDYLNVIHIMQKLHPCRTRSDLKNCFKQDILPFFEADDAIYGSHDINLIKGLSLSVNAMDAVRVPGDQMPLVNKMGQYFISFPQTFSRTHRKVIAHDVDIPRERLQKEIQNFFKDHPQYSPLNIYPIQRGYESSLGTHDSGDKVTTGILRYAPNHKLWTRREIRLMELLLPALNGAIKRVAIQEQVKTHQALIVALETMDTPMALVQEDGRVPYRNAAFSHLVPVKSGGVLPQPLMGLVEQQKYRMKPDRRPDSASLRLAFYQHNGSTHRLDLTELNANGNGRDPAWLLRLDAADDPHTGLHRTLQTAELTPREVEVAILAGDGLEDADIAQRLFISAATLKNHFRRIYKKLGVHSRTQLVANLRSSWNPIAGG